MSKPRVHINIEQGDAILRFGGYRDPMLELSIHFDYGDTERALMTLDEAYQKVRKQIAEMVK